MSSMKITRRQLRQIIREQAGEQSKIEQELERRKSDQVLTSVSDLMDQFIRAQNAPALLGVLERLQSLIGHYSEAEILQ